MINNFLTDEECCRWAALFECIYIINENAKRKNKCSAKIMKRLKPNHIREFVDGRYLKIDEEMRGGSDLSPFLNKFLYGD